VKSSLFPCGRGAVTCAEGSSLSQWYNTPPAAPPRIGAIQNSQSWPIAQPPTKRAGPVERAGLTEVSSPDADEVDQRQAESNRNRREACRCLPMRRAHDDEQEHHCQPDLGYEGGEEAVLTGECSP